MTFPRTRLPAITLLQVYAAVARAKAFLRSGPGHSMVEYALVLVLVGLIAVSVLLVLGKQVKNVFSNISGGLGG